MRMQYRLAKGMACGFVVLLVCCAGIAWAEGSADVDRLKASSWWAEAQKNLREQEYAVTWQEEAGALHAANRAANLRVYFRAEGVELIPRTGDAGWRWGYALTSFGREDLLESVSGVQPRAEGRRVDYGYDGLTEWYVNRDMGIEQGFVIHAPPRGDGALVINGRVSGDLEARLDADGQAVSFLHTGEEVLSYGKLVVEDADGRVLASHIKLEGDRLSVVIEEEGRYPITVDPLLTTPSWTAEGDQASANFGWAVSSAGDVNGDGYDDVIVGAYHYDNGETDEGRTYVFYGSASGLLTSAAWTAEGDQANAQFGCSVSNAGDVNGDGYDDVIVGAYAYSNDQSGEGRVFVYLGSATGLSMTPSWTAESDQAGAQLGVSVSNAGDVNGDGYDDVIASAPYYDNGQLNEGRVYVYLGSASGLANIPSWAVESDQALSQFGCSVSSAGDVNGDSYDDVIVGAYGYDNGQSDEGRAYLYYGSASGLSATVDWTAESDQAFGRFGFSVSNAGDVNGDSYDDVIVGAYTYSNGEAAEGRAYVYHGGDEGLSGEPAWMAEGDLANARFGASVSSAGDVNGDSYDDVIVGAYAYTNGQSAEGRAYVYHGSASGLSSAPEWTDESNQASAYFGWSVSAAGDVNGDSYGDVIVGAYPYDNGQTDEGRAYVYHGSPDPSCSVDPSTLDFGTVTTGTSGDLDFTITNTGGGVLSGTVSESCDHYSIVSGGGAYSLGAGEYVTVTVRFEPTSAGTHNCTIETGDALCGDVSCTGIGELPPACNIQPASLSFGTVTIGNSLDHSFTIRNNGGGTLSGTVSESCDHYSIVSGGGAYSLGAGEYVTVTVRFEPTSAGSHNCTIETGAALCGDVSCTGIGELPPACAVDPATLDFGTVTIGSSADRSFTIRNTGGGALSGTVSETCDHYSIVSGGGSYYLAAGQGVAVIVRFEPTSAGTHPCTIETGAACGDVSCTGVGGPPPACAVDPTTLDFGTVTTGTSAILDFTITNTGGGVLTGTVSESCDHYSIHSGGGAYTLGAGEHATVTVRFEPTSAGTHPCTIETGAECGDVSCTGVGELPPACAVVPTSLDFGAVAPNDSIVEKTFTIKNVGGGVLAGTVSERCNHFEIVSGGDAYSLGANDSVVVTLRFAPTENGLFECNVETGSGLCGDVYCMGLADETIPTFVQQYDARWAGGGVEIRWVLSGPSSSLSFEISRREGESGNYARLLSPDIARNGDMYVFNDRSAEPGRSYGYRVGIIEDGREVASFETSLVVPDARFALEQNYPNPFNPTTRIEFSVDREARVILAIYDISGRKVRTIVDRRLAASTYTEEWDARDADGRDVASGVYFIRLTAGDKTLTRKTVLLR